MVSARAAVPPEEQAAEHLIMGLRLAEGVDLDHHARLAGTAGLNEPRIARLIDLGLVTRDGPKLSATRTGRAVLNGVLRELLAD